MRIRVSPDVSVPLWEPVGLLFLVPILFAIAVLVFGPTTEVKAQDACAQYFQKAVKSASIFGAGNEQGVYSLAWSAIYENCRKYGGR